MGLGYTNSEFELGLVPNALKEVAEGGNVSGQLLASEDGKVLRSASLLGAPF